MKGFAVGLLNFLLSLSIAALGLVFMLNVTILNPDFVIAELDKVDAYSLVKEQIDEQLIGQIPQEAEFTAETITIDIDMTEIIGATFTDLEPWLKEQVRNGVHSAYDYLLGKSESLSLVISTEPIKESLRDNVWEAIQESPELAGLPQAEIKQHFDEFYQQISGEIPSTFEFNESSLSPEVMGIIEQVRQVVSYAEIAFKSLIALSAVLVAGIILLKREVRGSTRKIGVTFTVYGAVWFGGILAAKHFAAPQIAQLGLPAQIQTVIPQLLDDIVAPLQMFTLGFLIAGVVLIIVSHVYKPRQPYFESESPE